MTDKKSLNNLAPFDYSEVQLREIFKEEGFNDKQIDKACRDYMKYRENEYRSLFPHGLNIKKELTKDLEAYKGNKEMSFYSNVIGNMKMGYEIIEELILKYSNE